MKRLIISIFMAFYGLTNAQTLGHSPYNSYGIGDIKHNYSTDINSMAGISTAYVWDFNNQFNFKNPAANANLELSSIRFQGTNENQYLKSDYNNTQYNKHSTYLSGISIAFPLSKKVKFGLGYRPYSTKDYSIKEDIKLSDGTLGKRMYKGEGSLNIMQASFGFALSPQFSLGVTSNLYFGKIYDTEELYYNNTPLINGHEKLLEVNNFNFTLGSVYQKKFKSNKKLTLGATYTFGNTSDFKLTTTNSTYFLTDNNKRGQSIISQENKKSTNTLGQEYSFGIGYGHDEKWFISSQLDYKKAEKHTDLYKASQYKNSYRLALGGWFIPNYNNFRNYFSRITYRYGAFYEKGSLHINNVDINKYGLALGVSLPFQKNNINKMSSIDLGLELGQKGSLKNNLVKENFLNFTVGINFANKWFEKQYYD